MFASAQALQRDIGKLQAALLTHPSGAQRFKSTLAAAVSLRQALVADFEVGIAHERRPRVGIRSLQNQVQHLKRKRAEVKRKLDAAIGEKVSGRIQNVWYTRVALVDPSVPTRTLEQFCTSFPQVETQSISRTYIGVVRDAFAEVVKGMSKAAFVRLISDIAAASGSSSWTVFMLQIHDEALTRLRSYDASLPGRPIRGRSTKVQNNCVSLFCSDQKCEWPTELQPLGRKTGAVLGQCIVDVVSDVLRNISTVHVPAESPLRFVHVLTGDGVNTNENAGKRVLRFFLEHRR